MKPYRITIIGAESTGKTTLSRMLADELKGDWMCEFARPYLEVTDGQVTTNSMHAIWHGQHALQKSATESTRSYVVQDTDLFATIGYWELPHVSPRIGSPSKQLERDALELKSDLYLITQSNINFVPDPLRYGKDRRESEDQYWINLCARYKLPFKIIASSTLKDRLDEALNIIKEGGTL
jgi:nicotinamide riboside kinase